MKAILTYHSVDDTGSVISVTASQLERHLDALASRKAAIVPLTSLLELPGDSNALAITFDDGFANFRTTAAPLLAARGIPATVFVVPDAVGSDNSWESADSRARVPRLPLMTWDEVREVDAMGFEIGGHGFTHRSLSELSGDAARAEVERCFAALENEVGRPPAAFAFPYGDSDRAATDMVRQTFRIACTTRFGLLGDDESHDALPRLDMFYFRGGRVLRRWGTAEFAAYVAFRNSGRSLGRTLRRRRGVSAADRERQ